MIGRGRKQTGTSIITIDFQNGANFFENNVS
jgi:hypothetical protein